MTVHLALLPACPNGCHVHLVAYVEVDGGLLVERELDRNLSRDVAMKVMAFVEANAAQFNWSAFPLTDAWMPLQPPARPLLEVDYASLEHRMLAELLRR